MKKIILAVGPLLLASIVQAQVMLAEVVRDSDEVIQLVNKAVPIKTCQQENLPIYGSKPGNMPSTADVVAGAIFGGLVGNQVGGGSGKDAATVLGAIAGADMVNKSNSREQVVTGYKQQEVCNTVYENRSVREVVGYTTYVKLANYIWDVPTQSSYSKGSYLNVDVTLKAH